MRNGATLITARSMNCEGRPVRPGRPWRPSFWPLPQNYDISKPSYVVGTSNSSIHFHSVAIGAARRLSRHMRVQILTILQKKAWCFLSRFQAQRRVDAVFQSFLSFREYAISDVASQPLSPLNRAILIAANTFGFERIAFWGTAFFVA